MDCSSTADILDRSGSWGLRVRSPSAGSGGNGTMKSRPTRAMLLDAGASLTLRDSLLKSTLLGWACRWKRIEVVRRHLERGADAAEIRCRAVGNTLVPRAL
jgi:hypothetical protein